MFGLPPCEASEAHSPCPERFRASASEWIDGTNFGDLPEDKLPPGGIRLRWNWPLPSHEEPDANDASYPVRFEVYRCGPIEREGLMVPRVTAGHMPRMYAPRPMWRELMRSGDRDLVVGLEPCEAAQAIYIVMASTAEPVSIALIDTAGRTRITGELTAGDAFYYEVGDIHRVTFSAPPWLALAQGLSLSPEAAHAADLSFRPIAVVDARAWLSASLAEMSERMASDQVPPFVTISDLEWHELQQRGRIVVNALDSGSPAQQLDINYLELGIAMRWEVASLVGWGFLDGEHVAAPHYDRIESSEMLTSASGGVYAYQIVASFGSGKSPESRSDIALTIARPMPSLTPAMVTALNHPVTYGATVNLIDQTTIGGSPPPGPIAERTFCRSTWQITARAPYSERIFTRPRATDSVIVNDRVEVAGEFSGEQSHRPIVFRGTDRIEVRDHVFPVPYYDSDIWLTLATGDYWDRRVDQAPMMPVQPSIEYHGHCLGLSGGTCDSAHGTAKLVLDLASNPTWTADPLASFARATIELLVKDPELEEVQADVILYAASPAPRGNWTASIETELVSSALTPFIGGTLSADGFNGRIIGFAPEQRGRFRCEFESIAVCAGATLYNAGPKGIAARLIEAEGSDRVWEIGGAIPLSLDGSPASYEGSVQLPAPSTSCVIYCSTRLRFDFEGASYVSSMTARVGIAYVHPAPREPNLCFKIRTLGIDYYGRAVIRVEASNCEEFDPTLKVSLEAASGIVSNPAEFRGAASKGLFGPQSRVERVAFDAFEILGRTADDAENTLGVRYVRASDGRESEPELRIFNNRRTT